MSNIIGGINVCVYFEWDQNGITVLAGYPFLARNRRYSAQSFRIDVFLENLRLVNQIQNKNNFFIWSNTGIFDSLFLAQSSRLARTSCQWCAACRIEIFHFWSRQVLASAWSPVLAAELTTCIRSNNEYKDRNLWFHSILCFRRPFNQIHLILC